METYLADGTDGRRTRTTDIGCISKIGIDTYQRLALVCLHVLDHHISRSAIIGAVSTRTIKFAKVNDCEAVHSDSAFTIVLDNFVRGTECTTTNDIGRTIAFDGESIYFSLV
jgi:hypothetical protein